MQRERHQPRPRLTNFDTMCKPDDDYIAKLPFSTSIAGFLSFTLLYYVAIALNLALLLSTFFFPKTVGFYVFLPYLTYTLVLGRHEMKYGAHWTWFSKNFFLFSSMRAFLRMKLVVPNELQKADAAADSQFLFAVFPHGTAADYRVLMDGMLDSVLPNTAPKLRTLAATVLFRIPLVREMSLWTGCVDARRSVADKQLAKGNSVMVVVGGEAEQIRTVYGREIVYLQKRKGFLKLAMKHGVPVVPVYVFGASDYYKTSSAFFNLRLWLVKTFGVAIPLSWGFLGSSTCPLPIPTHVVFGKPLHLAVKEKGAPSADELDDAHNQFSAALVQLFDDNKGRYGYKDRKLEIV